MRYYTIVSGIGSHHTKIGSFDRALLDANIGNYNLIKVSSILPPGCEERKSIDLRFGSILYTAYTSFSNNEKHLFSSAIAVGIPQKKEEIGVIMEYSDFIDINDAKIIVSNMVSEAMRERDIALRAIVGKEISSDSIKINDCESGVITTFAAVALWGQDNFEVYI